MYLSNISTESLFEEGYDLACYNIVDTLLSE